MPRTLPTLHRSEEPIKITWKPIYNSILELVGRFRYLTATQINYLLNRSKGSVSYTQEEVSQLFHSHYLNAVWRKATLFNGGTPRFYYCDHRAKLILHKLGFAFGGLPTSVDAAMKELPYLEHVRDSNDAIIAAHRTGKLVGFKTDYDLKVMLRHERLIVPDAWVHLATPLEYGLAVECDRATESLGTIKIKAEKYLAFEAETYTRLFGTEYLTVVFAITQGGELRAKRCLQAIEQALSALNRQQAADMFRVAAVDLTVDHEEVFFAKRWHIPFDTDPVALIRRG